jgi:ABC-type phosphate transport system substrate-binding protein
MDAMKTHMSIARHGSALAVSLMVFACLIIPGTSALAQEIVRSSPIAIVVHKDTAVENLSLAELRNIFLANQQFWPNRKRIVLLVRAPKSEERDFVLNTIYEMDEAQFRQYWIAKMFRAEVPRGPKIVFSTDMMLELVIAIPGSISFVNAEEVTADVRVVRVDGKLPSEAGYPLR